MKKTIMALIVALSIAYSSIAVTQRSHDPVIDSIVKVVVTEVIPTDDKKKTIAKSIGTGFFISDSGLIMTAAHVIEGHTELPVFLSDKPNLEQEAVLVAVDYVNDIAILFVSVTESNPLVWCNTYIVGQLATAYAWRHDIVERTVGETGDYYTQDTINYWTMKIMIGPGFSGGPVYDHKRKCVLGITVKSNFDSFDPLSIYVRPELSKPIMEILQHFAPFKK